MNKHYTLIVGHGFSLANDTDSDVQSDYSPGIWGIKTQKSALRFAKEILADGDTITVTDYDNPKYHSLANKMIKELGLSQPLFQEPELISRGTPTNGKPGSLADLKRYMNVDTKIKMIWYRDSGNMERETFVKRVQTNSVVLDKNGGDSWLDWGKASEWSFDNDGATNYFMDRDGKNIPSLRIEYLNQ